MTIRAHDQHIDALLTDSLGNEAFRIPRNARREKSKIAASNVAFAHSSCLGAL